VSTMPFMRVHALRLALKPMRTSRSPPTLGRTPSLPRSDRSFARLRRRCTLGTKAFCECASSLYEGITGSIRFTQVAEKCPNCGHMEAFSKEMQVRARVAHVVARH
jgi:hypothetical protein